MRKNDIVCNCNCITVHDVIEFHSVYPNCTMENAKLSLSIGTRCKSCNIKDSPVIDRYFQDIWEEITNKK